MKKSFQRVIATLNLFQGKQSLTIFLLAAFFALSACDDSSSAGDDDNNVILSGDSREESSDSRSNDKDEAISSSAKVTDKDSDAKSSDSKSNDPAEVTDDSSDSKGNPSSAGTSTKSSNSNSSGTTTKSSNSSAGKEVSSSSEEMKSAWDYLNPDINYGEFTDERDGQVYKTVKIGDQVWMAQNLNYAYIDVPYNFSYNSNVYFSDSTSWCYDNDPANCAKYGRLYTWAAAMDSVGEWSTNGKGCGYGKTCSPTYPVRGICPKGWHLPSNDEWKALIVAVDDFHTKYVSFNTAGTKLKSVTGWSSNGNGTDAFGFSALPAGYRIYYRYNGGYFSEGNECAHFWSSTENSSNLAYFMGLHYDIDNAGSDNVNYENFGYSVRCLKDSE